MKKLSAFALSALFIAGTATAQKKDKKEEATLPASSYAALKFRNVGPAVTSGRIADLKVHPNNPNEWLVAVASGNVFKTTNHGTTFTPVFDNYGSYSVACVEYAPSNPNTVWLGSGENNNQRSVAYGDGVYKSLDGGNTWKNMGLKNSEHIGNIIIHPENENIVWVAAYGPLWSKGGERGVYMTTDAGETWTQTLFISENTGISEIAIDPSNPDILYAAAHQRRRHVYTYIGGGPESTLYKSTDGGKTWKESANGLPTNDMGRLGIAVSPADPNVVYAIVEARYGKQGFYKSVNKGESWSKQSDHVTSGNYYQEIICDPYNVDKVFSMDTWLHHTEDGGKTFKRTGEANKHVDNHTIWINPQNTDHWLVGCDGGIYETYNHAQDWKFYANLPVTQFYKVAVDNAEPFYYIYGGTQDNNSLGGPSQTINNAGILNSDWFITNGGDGFESAIDPVEPNIVYAQSQYGWLVRYDKSSGEKMGIQPQPGKGEDAYRWNWDAPLLISPHDHKTLYFAANKLFKSTDRGNSWQTISPDLTQQIDRNELPVMDQVWTMDAVMKNKSTTIYGNIVALDESPVQKGLLYVGTDDGLIQVSEDDGKTWTKIESVEGVPSNTYVNQLFASKHDANTVYAIFNNHKNGDFKPYVYVSNNKGKSWKNISNNLPEKGSTYCMEQDHKNKDLLFVGTEFGAFFSTDAGANWNALKKGLPTIAVRDMDIQERENDLVLASFGRGFYVLDDYALLRQLNKENLDKTAHLFSTPTADLYVQSSPLGLRGVGSQGAALYAAKNPKFGATFTLHLKDEYKTLKDERQEAEKEKEKNGEANVYPTLEELRAEKREEKVQLIWVITDAEGNPVRRLFSTPQQGTQRMTWNLRLPSTNPIRLKKFKPGRYSNPDEGPLVTPGTYQVTVYLEDNGEITELVPSSNFEVKLLENQILANPSQEENLAFAQRMMEINRKISGTASMYVENEERLKFIKAAIIQAPNADLTLLKEVNALEEMAEEIRIKMWGDGLKSSLEIETAPSIAGRVGTVNYQRYGTTAAPTTTQQNDIAIAEEDYAALRSTIETYMARVAALQEKLNTANIPYTKGNNKNFKAE